MGSEGMVERGPIDVLRVGRKVIANRCGKIDVSAVRHGLKATREGRRRSMRHQRWHSHGLQHAAGNSAQNALLQMRMAVPP
jgi:hypothetical protein